MTVWNQGTTVIGKVVSSWRYPVKSMLGEELNSSHVTERGLLGDRTDAVVDKNTGKVASAKNPRK
jgi:MOSC domain-containing protein